MKGLEVILNCGRFVINYSCYLQTIQHYSGGLGGVVHVEH